MNTFYSQHGEDRWISENLKPGIGTFCEVGAYDGVACSNTLHFEQLGWSGILVEPDPFLAAQCIANRKAKVWCCAAGMEGHGTFFINEDRGASGFNSTGKPITVLIKRLDWLLGNQPVDLVSIDTEGTEIEVWESLGSIKPRIVIMEYQTFDKPPKNKEITAILNHDGYHAVHRTPSNLIFLR